LIGSKLLSALGVMRFADEFVDRVAVFPQPLGLMEPVAFDECTLKLTGPLAARLFAKQCDLRSLGQKNPVTLGGSPVLAWRRQHRRNVRSVLPPLDRCGQDSKSDLADQLAWVYERKPSQRKRHTSLPPGVAVCKAQASQSSGSGSKVLWGGVQQGPPLRPSMTPTNLVKPRPTTEISAMALDLLSDQQPCASVKTEAGDDSDTIDASSHQKSSESEEVSEEDGLLPAPEGPVEQFWFSFEDFEAQVKQIQKCETQVPVPTSVFGFDLENRKGSHICCYTRRLEPGEFSADGDIDDNLTFVCYAQQRVRPGEFLEFDIGAEEQVIDIADEDVAVFTAGSAVEAGLYSFLAEVCTDDGEWTHEEEV
jgi:hypothetical protein